MGDILKAILGYMAETVAFLITVIVWAAVKIFLLISDGVMILLESIPVPGYLDDMGDVFSALPPGVMYFLEPFHFGTGLSFFISALVLRFLIRRLPVVG